MHRQFRNAARLHICTDALKCLNPTFHVREQTPAVAGVLLIGLHYTVDFAASAASHEIFSGVIESLRLRCADPVAKLTEALDAYAMDPGIGIPDLLFPLPTH